MSQNSTATHSGGIGLLGVLGIVFVTLKLLDIIDWSWWWVTLPFWGGLALVLGILVLLSLGFLVVAIIEKCTKT